MISSLTIHTQRLDLVPAGQDILTSDLHHDSEELGRLLDATIPGAWPPPLLDDEALAEFVRIQADGSDPNFSSWYWILPDPAEGTRTLIGSSGFCSYPTAPDAVMIGYSVIDAFQNRGLATEALRSLIPVIFQSSKIRQIVATTYPALKASIRVLEKTGFLPAGTTGGGEGMEEGTLLYVLERQEDG
jgi:RimJ/RimL family protein N-acetyltransferase